MFGRPRGRGFERGGGVPFSYGGAGRLRLPRRRSRVGAGQGSRVPLLVVVEVGRRRGSEQVAAVVVVAAA